MNTGQRRRRGVTAAVAAAVTLAATALVGLGATGIATAATPHSIHAYTAGPQAPGVDKQVQLYLAMRKLMGDHMHWTFATVDAFFHEPDEVKPKLTRLLANQTDIGTAIKPYYGNAAGDKLSTLLHAHINGYVPLLTDVKAGDSAKATTDFDAILANGVQIGKFLEAANPSNWPAPAVENMFTVHNKQTEKYALDLFKGDYPAAITDFETALTHMLDMADTLSAGIIAQFPNKFGGTATPQQRALYLAMRKLMGDHMHWTFATVDAFFHEPDEVKPKLTRLLANQTDIGTAIKPYYGNAAGDKLSTLLHAHINGYVPLLTDVKAGDTAKATTDFDAILANGVQIGKFLEAANPSNWPAPAVENMFTVHNKQTEKYALDLFKGDYPAAITDFETALTHMLDMADTLSAGIIAQFPNKFGQVTVVPKGSVNTGGGATAGVEDIALIVLGGVLLAIGAGVGAAGYRKPREQRSAA